MKKTKIIVVNFVAVHSYVFIKNMIEGLTHNGCRIFAVVSKNMPEIDKWRNIKGMKLYEVDGYTDVRTFPVKLARFYIKDVPKIRHIVKRMDVRAEYIPICSYWSWFIHFSLPKMHMVYAMHDPVSHNETITWIRLFNYILARQSEHIIILSDTFREHVKRFYKKRDDQIVTIPGGCENVSVHEGLEKLVDYDDNKINFLFQGRIDAYKGLHILANAYRMLRKKYDNVTLTVAGSGDFSSYKNAYKDLEDCPGAYCVLHYRAFFLGRYCTEPQEVRQRQSWEAYFLFWHQL